MDDTDKETLELEFLANNTPTRFAKMIIIDDRTNLKIEVDQSLDSALVGTKEQTIMLIEEFLNIYFYWKTRKYSGEFDGKHKIKINHLIIDFGRYEGIVAWKWLMRYVKVMLDLMEKNGVLNLSEVEEDYNKRMKEKVSNG